MIDIATWDSDFFNLRVGIVHPGKFQLEKFQQEKNNFDLIYISEHSGNAKMISEIERLNIKSLDVKLIYSKHVTVQPMQENIMQYQLTYVNTKLHELSLESGIYSRFRNDPRMGYETFARMYTRWIERSVNREIADIIYIHGSHDAINGFVTVARNSDCCQIGLIAVDDTMRGKGVAQALIACCENYTTDQQLSYLKVATQLANKSACNLYTRCGFVIESSTNIYHYWN
ncbi:MAG: GNAT family N-acetyltransferase [Bacteroidetes bacterium]|nr:GNAT family N-acetyltransferase [Bacteroidota bacterium]